ncbi:hypothetical protein DRA43_16380 [Micromonospora provocatoris]|nr:hypothetical protein [Micromonospora provocatoris]RBJ02793.1 hypothetical protein DRA43_16380 [Micromonospora provocatoris]
MKLTRSALGISAFSAVAVAIGTSAMIASAPAEAAIDADAMPAIEEDFQYPGADQIQGIRMIKGDGHVLHIECDKPARSIEVWSFTRITPFCFEVRGTTGYVTLELADVYGIRNYNDFGLDAKVTVSNVEKSVDVPVDDWVGVGVGADEGPAVLLEIRA